MTKAPVHKTAVDPDEALDDAAQGYASEGDDEDTDPDDDSAPDEIDAMGVAAGVVVPDGKALGGADPIERRDDKRWENDPGSADDAVTDRDRTAR